MLVALNSAIAQSLQEDHTINRSEADVIRIFDPHEAVVERVCARDALGAAAAMSCHFDLSVNSLAHGNFPRHIT
jgi:DNA-binding GntR family transcriptional regulator